MDTDIRIRVTEGEGDRKVLYAVLFEDDADRADMRSQHMPDHLAFLEAHANVIKSAGPLIDAGSRSGAGGSWPVEADKPETVDALYRADPFWSTGLHKSVRVLEWKQVFADRKRLI
jgi:uncharacterized protein YciI